MLHIREIVTSALSEVLRSTPVSPGKVEFAWRVVVGPALQRVTTVQWRDDGTLEVTADARWGREIERSAPLIRQRLDRMLGEGVVRKLRINKS